MKQFVISYNKKKYKIMAKDHKDALRKASLFVKDSAYDRSTIEALISDEKAAMDAYNVAIANLDGKLSDIDIKVLQAIRDDEETHLENLYAILSSNVTEKNLHDSKIKDLERKDFGDARVVEQNGKTLVSWYSLGPVTVAEAERFMRDLQKAIDYARTQR